MKVRVSDCWAGNSNYYFQFETPKGDRFRFKREEGAKFGRQHATTALNILERMGYERKNIRFQHR